MALKTGMSTINYGRIERNEKDISLSQMTKIATILELSVSQLFESPEKYVFERHVHNSQVGGVNNKYEYHPDSKTVVDLLMSFKSILVTQNLILEKINLKEK